MFDLFLNGLSIVGSVGSVVSYVNGFALERDIRQIRASLQHIERINEELRGARMRVPDNLVGAFLGDLSGLRSFGEFRDPSQVFKVYEGRLREEFRRQTSSLLEEMIGEFRSLSRAVRVAESKPLMIEEDLFDRVRVNPGDVGVRDVIEVPDGRLLQAGRPHVVTAGSSPVVWEDPWSRRRFMGSMPTTGLQRYGLGIEVPRYKRAKDGFIYSEAHGLYLPILFLER